MAKRVFRPYDPTRPLPLPADLRQWLPADPTVYLLSDLVDQLDLAPITSAYERGTAAATRPTIPCCGPSCGSTPTLGAWSARG